MHEAWVHRGRGSCSTLHSLSSLYRAFPLNCTGNLPSQRRQKTQLLICQRLQRAGPGLEAASSFKSKHVTQTQEPGAQVSQMFVCVMTCLISAHLTDCNLHWAGDASPACQDPVSQSAVSRYLALCCLFMSLCSLTNTRPWRPTKDSAHHSAWLRLNIELTTGTEDHYSQQYIFSFINNKGKMECKTQLSHQPFSRGTVSLKDSV